MLHRPTGPQQGTHIHAQARATTTSDTSKRCFRLCKPRVIVSYNSETICVLSRRSHLADYLWCGRYIMHEIILYSTYKFISHGQDANTYMYLVY
jgi:hypothetical protein